MKFFRILFRFFWLKIKELFNFILNVLKWMGLIVSFSFVVTMVLNFIGFGLYKILLPLGFSFKPISHLILWGCISFDFIAIGTLFIGVICVGVGFAIWALYHIIKAFIKLIIDNWHEATKQIYSEELQKTRLKEK